MVVHNPNNWHWVDKNCLQWSKDYFNKNISNTTYGSETIKYIIPSIDISGDCDVTQRKGKVLCIYDMKLQFTINGEAQDDKVTGNIILPEFIHDQDEDEYIFEINVDDGNREKEIKTLVIPVLKEKLMKFQSDLLETHAKDVQHQTN
ncbi:unnamed protein product [Candida verbasci]|uniref:Activator of Hsp90 ATPase AHSA1-like N-terminal domain-containing protein n=1 Tax=Candida verbasci TaxID=1227364 RepID=A0A9W4U0L4_9ASCO|nr:unnamed protein product [Candida verbasci]